MENLEKEISDNLIKWYNKNARPLPWRQTTEPYKIWLSEIILQQTTVKQGLPYYKSFITNYPTLKELAESHIDAVLKLWQGLGYYSRARNLHETSRYIFNQLNGVFPKNYKDLLKLKGVGKYTAAAIASFCYKEPEVVVDGNVKRFISRLFGITSPVDVLETEKEIRVLAQNLLSFQDPSVFNQAIMEMGALQCVKQNPDCSTCVMNSYCIAYTKKLVDKIPLKSKKIKRKTRYFYFCVAVDPRGKTYIKKRSEKDIWEGLYDFPLLETKDKLESLPKLADFGIENIVVSTTPSKIYKHQLTHQKLFAQFIYYNLKVNITDNDQPSYLLINLSDIEDFAVPRLIDLYLSDLSITLF